LRLDVDQRKVREWQAADVPLWQSAKEGLRYLRGHELARTLVTMEWLEHIPHGVWTSALMLVFVEEALHGEAQAWGLQNGAFYAGVMLGSVLAAAVTGPIARWPGRIIIINAFLMGFLTIIYASAPTVLITIIISILYGPMFALRDVSQNSLLQATVDEDKLGRVFALREMGWNVVFLMSGLTLAWLGDYLPIRAIYMLAAVGYLLTAVYAFSSRALRQSKIRHYSVTGNR
jgi:MFS family permease